VRKAYSIRMYDYPRVVFKRYNRLGLTWFIPTAVQPIDFLTTKSVHKIVVHGIFYMCDTSPTETKTGGIWLVIFVIGSHRALYRSLIGTLKRSKIWNSVSVSCLECELGAFTLQDTRPIDICWQNVWINFNLWPD